MRKEKQQIKPTTDGSDLVSSLPRSSLAPGTYAVARYDGEKWMPVSYGKKHVVMASLDDTPKQKRKISEKERTHKMSTRANFFSKIITDIIKAFKSN